MNREAFFAAFDKPEVTPEVIANVARQLLTERRKQQNNAKLAFVPVNVAPYLPTDFYVEITPFDDDDEFIALLWDMANLKSNSEEKNIKAEIAQELPVSANNAPTEGILIDIALENIKPNPNQPRSKEVGWQIDELAESMKSSGLREPISVVKVADGWILEYGERRVLAAKRLGWKTIKAIERPYSISDEKYVVGTVVENLQRQNLDPISKAECILILRRHLIKTKRYGDIQINMKETKDEYASNVQIDKIVQQIIGINDRTQYNLVKLYSLSPPSMKEKIRTGELAVQKAQMVLDIATEQQRDVEDVWNAVLAQKTKKLEAAIIFVSQNRTLRRNKSPFDLNSYVGSLIEEIEKPLGLIRKLGDNLTGLSDENSLRITGISDTLSEIKFKLQR